jgi:hypothetical protein
MDSPRKIDKKNNASEAEDKNSDQKNKKKNWYETHTAVLNKQNVSTVPPSKNFSITYNEEAANHSDSPGKML